MDAPRAPRTFGWLVAAASLIVPRPLRAEWKGRWDNQIFHWWAFLAEHGALDRDSRHEVARHVWRAFPDAVRTRWGVSGARVLAFLRSPGLALALAAAPIVLVGALSGFSGLRALVAALPYEKPERLVLLTRESFRQQTLNESTVIAWRRAVRLEGLAAYATGQSRIGLRTVTHARAEENLFDLLGARAAMGSLSDAGDVSGPPPAVISHALWRREFRSDPAAVGRVLRVDDRDYRVIGVTAPEFWFYDRDVAVWTTLQLDPSASAGGRRYWAVARLKDFARPRDVERELSNIAWELSPRRDVWTQAVPLDERLRFSLFYYLGLLGVVVAASLAGAALGFRGSRRGGAFLAGRSALLAAGLALLAIEIPAALASTSAAGRGYFMEGWFVIATGLALWWSWRDARRRCRVCLYRLTFPVSFGNWGSPLLDRVGTELVCERGHGTLYVSGMHWSSSEPERWTEFDSSYNDLFSGEPPPPQP
jgi:hypothetical protein